jgi:hypothetical protein
MNTTLKKRWLSVAFPVLLSLLACGGEEAPAREVPAALETTVEADASEELGVSEGALTCQACPRYRWETNWPNPDQRTLSDQYVNIQMEVNVCISGGKVTNASGGIVKAFNKFPTGTVTVSDLATSFNEQEGTLTAYVNWSSSLLNLLPGGTPNPLPVTMRVVPAGASANIGCYFAFNSGSNQRCPFARVPAGKLATYEAQWCTSPTSCTPRTFTLDNRTKTVPALLSLSPSDISNCSLCFWRAYSSTCNLIAVQNGCDPVKSITGCGQGSYEGLRIVSLQ